MATINAPTHHNLRQENARASDSLISALALATLTIIGFALAAYFGAFGVGSAGSIACYIGGGIAGLGLIVATALRCIGGSKLHDVHETSDSDSSVESVGSDSIVAAPVGSHSDSGVAAPAGSHRDSGVAAPADGSASIVAAPAGRDSPGSSATADSTSKGHFFETRPVFRPLLFGGSWFVKPLQLAPAPVSVSAGQEDMNAVD